jgi:hypothetical protein
MERIQNKIASGLVAALSLLVSTPAARESLTRLVRCLITAFRSHASWRLNQRLALAFIAGAVLAFTSVQDAAATFTPSASYSLSNSAANGDADTTFNYSVSGPGEERTDFVSMGARVDAAVAPGPGSAGFIPGTHPALGDIAADVQASWTLALAGGACNSPIVGAFRPLNATVNNSSGNVVFPSLPSEENAQGKMSPLISDTYTVSPGTGSAGPGSAPPPPVNGLPAFVERYPSYLNTILDTDNGPGVSPAVPLARYAGGAIFAGTAAVTFDILVFEPGAMAAFTPPHPLHGAQDSPSFGYHQLIVVNGKLPFSSAVTGQCQPESYSNTLFGASRTNPCNGNTASPCNTTSGINFPAIGAATARDRYRNSVLVGTLQWLTWATSVIGNDAIVAQDLAVTAGTTATDSEGDGIHDGIDGTFQSFSFLNRSMFTSASFTDQHFAGGKTFGSVTSSAGLALAISDQTNPTGVQIAASGAGGPAIVSVCGIATLSMTSGDTVNETCSSATTAVLSGPVTEQFGTIAATLPAGTTSTVTDQGGGNFQVSNSAGSSTSITVGGLIVSPNQTVVVTDPDGDGQVNQADTDDDNDAFSDVVETYVGTNPSQRCGTDAWPADINNDGFSDISDVSALTGDFGDAVPSQAPTRHNIAPDPPDGFVDITDISRMTGLFGQACATL